MEKFNTAVILAGGKSMRMGFDKQTLFCNGKRLMDQIITKLREIFQEVIIVTNHFELYDDPGLILITDEIRERGPLGGIHAGLRKSSSRYIYTIACDMPVVNPDYIRYMMERLENNESDACVTKRGDRIEPFNAFYCKSLIEPLEKQLQGSLLSISYFLKGFACVIIEEDEARRFSSDWSMFSNMNTLEDMTRNHCALFEGSVDVGREPI